MKERILYHACAASISYGLPYIISRQRYIIEKLIGLWYNDPKEVKIMTEQECHCVYLKEFIDPELCYDMQMICNGFIKPAALPDIEIDNVELLKCCNECKHNGL